MFNCIFLKLAGNVLLILNAEILTDLFVKVATDRMVSTEESVWNVEEHNQNITLRKNILLE